MIKDLIKVAEKLDQLGLVKDANSIDGMLKVLASDSGYQAVYQKLLGSIRKNSLGNIVEEESGISNKILQAVLTRTLEVELSNDMIGSFFQKIIIKVDGSDDQGTVVYGVQSILTSSGTTYGDFSSTMSDSMTEKEYRFLRGDVNFSILKMISEITDNQIQNFEEFVEQGELSLAE